MAKIFAPPKEVPVPKPDYENFDLEKYQKDVESFTAKLREYCLANGKDTERGETITFPVADGCAQYMVFSMKPVKLIHMPLGDAWEYQDADLQTAMIIREKIHRQKAFAAIFSRDPA
jgi:hypothetical protein